MWYIHCSHQIFYIYRCKIMITLRRLIIYCFFKRYFPNVYHWFAVGIVGCTTENTKSSLLMCSMPCLLYSLKQFSPGLRFLCHLGKWTQLSGVSPPPSYIRHQSSIVDQDSPFAGCRGSWPPPLLYTVVIYREHFPRGQFREYTGLHFLASLLLFGWLPRPCRMNRTWPNQACRWSRRDRGDVKEDTMRKPLAKPKVQHIIQNKSPFPQTNQWPE